MKTNTLYQVDLSEYHAELDKKHLEICEKTGVTFERLVELEAAKMKHSVAWASWILQKQSITKLDYKAACLILESV